MRQAKETHKTNKPLAMLILSQREIVSFSLGKRPKIFNIEDARTRRGFVLHPRQKSEDRAAWWTPNDFVKSGLIRAPFGNWARYLWTHIDCLPFDLGFSSYFSSSNLCTAATSLYDFAWGMQKQNNCFRSINERQVW